MKIDNIHRECEYSGGALNELVILSVTHKTVESMEGLSALSFSQQTQEGLLNELKEVLDAEEMVYVSTCNRVSFIILSRRRPAILLKVLCSWLLANGQAASIPDESQWIMLRGKQALDHLLLVASSLDSMVVGEGQILGQLKESFVRAQKTGISGPKFYFLYEQILKVAKRVYSNTQISHGRLSVVSLAEGKISEFCRGRDKVKAVLVGSGKMIERMAEYLRPIPNVELLFVNRTKSRSDIFRKLFGGSSLSLNEYFNDKSGFDILVTSTSAPHHLFGPAFFQDRQNGKDLLLIDLAIPKDIDPAVETLKNISLINMESLREESLKHASDRQDSVKKAQEIIEEGSIKIIDRWKIRTINPAIGALKRRYEQESLDQLNKLIENKLPHLEEEEKEELSTWALKMAKHWAVVHASGVKRTARDCCMKAVMTYLDGTGTERM